MIKTYPKKNRVEKYAESLQELLNEIPNAALRETVERNGKRIHKAVVDIYGVKDFLLIEHNNGKTEAYLITWNDILHDLISPRI